ncbi:MAG: hypothetical protein ACOH19_06095 [Rhodoglobus sp.]
MSEPTTAQPVENVSRGVIFALVAIPISIAASALFGGLFGIASGIVALVIAYVTGWLFSKGSGGPFEGKSVGPAGRLPYILIASAAVILGAMTSIIAAVYSGFTSVNGRGGLFGAPFATTLGRALQDPEDFLFPMALCLVFGLVGIAGVVRGPRTPAANVQQPVQPGTFPAANQTVTPPPVMPTAAAPAAPSAPVAPLTQPPAGGLINQPSPGIILNGKPIDPSKQ